MPWNEADPPAGWVHFPVLGRWGNLALEGEALTFEFRKFVPWPTLNAPDTDGLATSYEVRDYGGAVVQVGSVSGHGVTLDPLPLGWYVLYLLRAASVSVWGHLIGRTTFAVVRDDANLIAPPARTDPEAGIDVSGVGFQAPDHAARGVAVLGPWRAQIYDASDPNGTEPYGADQQPNIANAALDQVRIDRWYGASPDAARPRPTFLQFTYGTYESPAHLAGVTETVAALFPSIEYYEGPANEPDLNNAADWAGAVNAFVAAVKAGHPDAKAMGPAPVSINGAMLGRLDAFLGAGGAVGLDALSFHVYNCFNGDIALGRKSMDALMDVLDSHGLADIELWQSECGGLSAWGGMLDFRLQGRWWLLQRLLLDQYGIPKERDHFFYDTSHGFWGYPSFWRLGGAGGQSLMPMIALTRVYSAELFGKVWAERLDFGSVENVMYVGSRYAADDGSAVLAMVSGGRTDGRVTLEVEGTDVVEVVGPFGAVTLTAVRRGRVSVAVGVEPVYVRLPVGVSAVVVPRGYGTNVTRWGATVLGGSTADEREKVVNHRHENSFYLDGGGESEFRDDAALPAAVTLQLPVARRIDTVLIYCPSPVNDQGTLLDFDVQIQDEGDSWQVVGTVVEPTGVVEAAGDFLNGWCSVDSFFSGRRIFAVEFAATVAKAVRLSVRAATYGLAPNAAAAAAIGAAGVPKIRIQEVEVYCRDTQRPRVVVAP